MQTSWQTTLKIYARNNLLQSLSDDLILSIPKNNIHKWENESKNKQIDCRLTKSIRKEINFITKTREFPNVKKTAEAHIKIMECLFRIFNKIKKYKTIISNEKVDIVNTIEYVKNRFLLIAIKNIYILFFTCSKYLILSFVKEIDNFKFILVTKYCKDI